MQDQLMLKRIHKLHQRLRVLILQNAHEETAYDDRFLQEVRELADEILILKQRYGTHVKRKVNTSVPVYLNSL